LPRLSRHRDALTPFALDTTTNNDTHHQQQGDFNLTNAQDGLLASAFLVGLLVASPLFSDAAKHTSAFRLIALGTAAWVVAVVGCALAPGFLTMMLCRALTGVGEAAFVALAAPFVDDYSPPGRKASWLACFYLCIPCGFALGYLLGGAVAPLLGWRAAFLAEALLMMPFVVFSATAAPPHLCGSREGDPRDDPTAPHSVRDAWAELRRDSQAVLSHRLWRWSCAGYVPYTAVLGAYAFWGPKAGRAIFGLDPRRADAVFGAVTVATGVGGSAFGGLLLDKLGGTARAAAGICSFAAAGGMVLALLAFLAAPTFAWFVATFAAAELAMFSSQAPVGALGLWSVPPGLRPLGISLTTTAIHLLGDVPSPPLVGWLQSALERGVTEGGGGGEGGGGDDEAHARGQKWRLSMAAVTVLLALASAAWARAAGIAGTPGAPDYNSSSNSSSARRAEEEEEEEEEGTGVEAAAGAVVGAAAAGAAAAAPSPEARPLLVSSPGAGGGSSSRDSRGS
jgi:MFS transporter, Spinster family, sphingosine-1-phosphate transporter